VAEELAIHTTVVDFDLPFGTAGLDFNDEAGQGVAEALASPERLDDVLLDRLLIKRGDHLCLFTAPASLERDYNAGPEAYEAVIDVTRSSSPCVIVDLPHAWSPWIKNCLVAADEIVIVATLDLASLRNAKNIMELVRHARSNDPSPRLLINQANTPMRPRPWVSSRSPCWDTMPPCSARPPTTARCFWNSPLARLFRMACACWPGPSPAAMVARAPPRRRRLRSSHF